MSSLAQPTMHPIINVIAPTAQTNVWPVWVRSNSGFDRAMRYTPAVTIVAAWISADTGVGPSIASGSQVCNGNWPDLPQAPSSSRSVSATSVPEPSECALLKTPWKETVPSWTNISMMAIDSPTSPTRLTTNAFFAAVAALGRPYQKPMSRYEATPTPSQPTYRAR